MSEKITQLKKQIEVGKFEEVFNYLDLYFDKNDEYINLKYAIIIRMVENKSLSTKQTKSLLIFLNCKKIKKAIYLKKMLQYLKDKVQERDFNTVFYHLDPYLKKSKNAKYIALKENILSKQKEKEIIEDEKIQSFITFLDDKEVEKSIHFKENKEKISTIVFLIIVFVAVLTSSILCYYLYTVMGNKKEKDINVVEQIETGTIEETKNGCIFTQEGQDKEGRKAIYKIEIIDSEMMYWGKADSNCISIYDRNMKRMKDDDIIKYFKESKSMAKYLDSCLEIVLTGTASQEEKQSLPKDKALKDEEERAERRAKNMAGVFSRFYTKPIYVLNFGQHAKKKVSITDYQRTIIVIGVLEKEEGINQEESIYNAITNTKDWLNRTSIEINNYSKVDSANKRFEKNSFYCKNNCKN